MKVVWSNESHFLLHHVDDWVINISVVSLTLKVEGCLPPILRFEILGTLTLK